MKDGKLVRRERNVYYLILCTKNVNFRDVVGRKKPCAQPLHIIAKLPVCEAIRSEGIDDAIGVTELVVEEWADDALWQVLPDVADLLAYLIPDVRHISAYHRAFEGDENRRCAGKRIALDVVETRSFLELLLYPICDLLQRVRDVGARPKELNHHGLDCEIRIFIAAQSQIRQTARRNADDDQKPDERAVPQRPFRNIEAAAVHFCAPAPAS